MSGARGVAKAAQWAAASGQSPPPQQQPPQQQQALPRPVGGVVPARTPGAAARGVGGASASSLAAAVAASSAAASPVSSSAARAARVSPDSLTVAGESYGSSRVLDLRDQAYSDLHVLHAKFPARNAIGAYPWNVMILSGNLLTRLDSLSRCRHLRKLDLSRNALQQLPKGAFWKQLPHLQVLLLHHNQIDSIHALQQLSCLPDLEILTCFGNAVEHHPAYRHVLVNVLPRLLLLDFYLVSDAELIEGAQWGADNKFAPFASSMECDVLSMHQALDGSERAHMQVLDAQLEVVRKQHARFSPVLKIQALFRGVLVRRTIKVYHEAARAIQVAWRRYRARRMARRATSGGDGGDGSGAEWRGQGQAGSSDVRSPPRSGPHPLSSPAAHTIFLVHTSDVAVSLFMQLVKRVEQSEGMIAPDLLDASVILLSRANIQDDYPLVRKIYPHRKGPVQAGCKLLPGKHCDPACRASLNVLRARPSGAVLSEHARFLLHKRISQHTYPHRFLQFQSPGARFHELLIRAVHAYNIEMGNYNNQQPQDAGAGAESVPPPPPSLDPLTSDLAERERLQQQFQLGAVVTQHNNHNKVIIYPGTTINVISAAVAIQSTYRSYRARKWLQPSIGERLARRRAGTAIVRWWRQMLFRVRMHLLCGLKRYGDSINSRHLFCRGDILLLFHSAPNPFVDREFMPEHRCIFGIEPKEDAAFQAARREAARALPSPAHPTAGDVDADVEETIGKLTLVVDRNTPKRFYPFPRWLAAHWKHQPLPVVHGFTDSGIRSDLSSRMTELLQEGVNMSVLPDVSQPAALDQRQPGGGAGGGWNSSNFIKLSFASVEEARNRALVLAINTWLPSFHLLRPWRLQSRMPFTSATPASQLAGSEMALLMTPQHMTLCLQYQQAGGPSGPSGERHILYTTFWTNVRTAPAALYSNQAYLDLQYQLRLVEEAHIAAEKQEQRSLLHPGGGTAGVAPTRKSRAGASALDTFDRFGTAASSTGGGGTGPTSADDLEIVGDDGVSTWQPSIFALKREAAESERLLSRRSVAQARIQLHTAKMVSQELAREQTVMHRIKMEHLAQREIEARRQRQLDYERLDAAARATRDRFMAAKHALVHQRKHDQAQRAHLRQLDREQDAKELKQRVQVDKQSLAKALVGRVETDQSAVASRVQGKQESAARHRRLLEEKESTLSFMSAQNMISRQLSVGMRHRLHTHQQQKIAATVQARREVAQHRRHQVHEVLFENWNRRREAALAQQLEMRSHVQLRAVKDDNKVSLMRARRQHLQSVRALAQSAALSTLHGGGGGGGYAPPNQHELHAALLHPSAHLVPHADAGAVERPRTSASAVAAAAYLPHNPIRAATNARFPGDAPASASSPASVLLPSLGQGRGSRPRSSGGIGSAASPSSSQFLHPLAGDQLTLQINTLRELADKVKLQFQTAAAAQQAYQ